MNWKKREPILKPRGRDGIIEKLARIRGIDDIQEFLYPQEDSLHSPKFLKNIDTATKKIVDALMTGKKICLSGDCDTDGIMALGLSFRYLSQFTDNIYYIYNQRSEGHGIENQMNYIEENTDLLIILDSSSNSVKACKELSQKGIDIIVLDHHNIDVENPYVCLVNPQNDDYPNKQLSGSGVAFKTMQVIDKELGTDTVWEFIDLCAIGMYGDMMDVSVKENRYLIIEGMKNINNAGIRALLDVKKVNLDNVNSSTIGFTIAPMLNGSARMDKIEMAIDLVLSDDYKECMYIAEEMDKLNEERKTIQSELAKQYSENIDFEDKILIATDKMASKSFNGLVATKISQENKKPTLVMREHKGSLAGSYRTYGDFDVQKFLRKCPYVQEANGHTFAGGVKLFAKDLQKFKDYVNENLEGVVFDSDIEYDLEIDVSEITEDFIISVEKFNYLTGQGFPSATFRVTGIMYDSDSRSIIGKNKNVVKIQLEDITLMKFGVKEDYALDIADMSEIEVVGELNLNIWISRYNKEYRTNQVFIEDYRVL